MQPTSADRARQPARPGVAGRTLASSALAPTLLIIALLVIWEVAVKVLATPTWLLPPPSQVVRAAWDAQAALAIHTRQTLVETLVGLAVALVTGFALAVAIDIAPMLRRAIYPLLVTSQTIPIIALAPLLIIWFGFGLAPKVIIVALVCFFPIAVSTADALRSVDPDLVALLRAMGADRWEILAKVRLPAALPGFFSGLKIAVTYAMIGAIVGEWVGASEGLGIFMLRSQRSFLTDQVFAAIAVTSAISILLFLLVVAIERLTLPWYYTSARSDEWEELTRRH